MKRLIPRWAAWALGVVCVLAAMVFLVPGPLELNCLHVSFDIAAGRVRHERYVLLVKVSDTVDEGGLYALYCQLFPGPSGANMGSRQDQGDASRRPDQTVQIPRFSYRSEVDASVL